MKLKKILTANDISPFGLFCACVMIWNGELTVYNLSFLPAAEVVKQETDHGMIQDDCYYNNNNNGLLPSPMLSPHVSLSSDDETEVSEPVSPPNHGAFQLDDLLDWEGQQTM